MKKQGSVFLKIGLGAIGLCLLGQAVYHMLLPRLGDLTTQPAKLCEVGDGISVSGFVVRDEVVLPALEQPRFCPLSAGQWAAAGQTVAQRYATQEQLADQIRRQALLGQCQGIETALRDFSGGAIEKDLVAMSRSLAAGTLPEVQALKGRILCRSDPTCAERYLNQLRARLSGLPTPAPAETIAAPAAGYFYPDTDGWERQLTPQALQTLPPLHPARREASVGKLIVSNTWYYVANVPTQALNACQEGAWITVRFSRGPSAPMRMQVCRMVDEPGGSSVVILECDCRVAETLALREVSAELLFRRQTGLQIPKQSVYLDSDGAPGVYVLQGAQAVWKPVCLLADCGGGYLVQLDQSSTANLWPEDQIICTDEPLYDGKVIVP